MKVSALRTAVLCFSLVFLAGDAASPRQTPDFSGVWLLKTSPDPSPDTPRKLVVNQTATTISIERQFANRTTSESHRLSLSGGTVGGQGETSFKGVMWFADRLMFHEESRTGPRGAEEKSFERGEDWWLDEDGFLTVEIRIRQSDAPRSSVTLKYARQSKPGTPGGPLLPR